MIFQKTKSEIEELQAKEVFLNLTMRKLRKQFLGQSFEENATIRDITEAAYDVFIEYLHALD